MHNLKVHKVNKFFSMSSGLSLIPNKKHILKNISFTIKKNEILGLIGRNGAGKSTLIKIIAGLILPDSGSVEAKTNKVNLVNSNPRSFYWRLSCMDNLKFFGGLGGISSSEIASKTIFYLDTFNMKNYIDVPFRNLSSGQMQLMSLVRSLILKPNILLLDEPTANLDYYFKTEYINVVKAYIAENQGSAIWSSHDFQEIDNVADSYSILRDKKLYSIDKKSNFYSYESSHYYIEVDIESLNVLNSLKFEFIKKSNAKHNGKIFINLVKNTNNISIILKEFQINGIKIYSVVPIKKNILAELIN